MQSELAREAVSAVFLKLDTELSWERYSKLTPRLQEGRQASRQARPGGRAGQSESGGGVRSESLNEVVVVEPKKKSQKKGHLSQVRQTLSSLR